MHLFDELNRRRVLPAIGVFVAGVWVLVEILDRLVDRYLLSPYITDIVFWGLYSLIPAVALVAWTHGQPGRDRITRIEMVGIPINLIATLGLLLTLFGSKDLGATADRVEVSNEFGETQSYYVARDEYRKRLALFFWDADALPEDQRWLNYGITTLLAESLSQNPYLVVNHPLDSDYHRMPGWLERAGYKDGLGVPDNVMRSVARRVQAGYWINGSIAPADEGFRVDLLLHTTDGSLPVERFTEQGSEPARLVGRLAERLRKFLEVPEGRARLADHVAVAEIFSTNTRANAYYTQALAQRELFNDYEAALEALDQALALDPSFSLATLQRGITLGRQGQVTAALEPLREAIARENRLSAHEQLRAKQVYYRLSGDSERLRGLLDLQVQLRDSAAAYQDLAEYHAYSGRPQEALAALEAAYQRDPGNAEMLGQLSTLSQAVEDSAAAMRYAEAWIAAYPDQAYSHVRKGDLLRDAGRTDEALEYYRQATIVDSSLVGPPLRLAELALRRGDWQAARDWVAEAEAIAGDPEQRRMVLEQASRLAFVRGQLRRAIEIVEESREWALQYARPLDIAFMVDTRLLALHLYLGDDLAAERILTATESNLEPPFDQFMQLGWIHLHLQRGDVAAATAASAAAREAFERFEIATAAHLLDIAEGRVAQQADDPARAATLYERAIYEVKHSVIAHEMGNVLPELYAYAATARLAAGDNEAARRHIDDGLRLTDAAADLWVARARYQQAVGQTALARASVAYALAILADADPDYMLYREASRLASELNNDTTG